MSVVWWYGSVVWQCGSWWCSKVQYLFGTGVVCLSFKKIFFKIEVEAGQKSSIEVLADLRVSTLAERSEGP